MKNGRPQAKDIPNADVLRAVVACRGRHGVEQWAVASDVVAHLGLPEKLVLVKARALIHRGLMDGCTCGCRGDFELTREGAAFLGVPHLLRGADAPGI